MTRRWILAGAGLIAIAVVLSAVSFNSLPAMVVTHWDMFGNPNGWSSRSLAVSIVPVIMLIVLTATALSPRPKEPSAIPLLVIIGLAGVLCLHGVMLGLAAGRIAASSAPRILTVLFSIMLIAIGNYLPRAGGRNPLVGVRLPWTFADSDSWQRAQRLGGYGLVAAGIVGLAAVLIVPSWSLPVVAAAVVAQMLLVSVASYRSTRSAR